MHAQFCVRISSGCKHDAAVHPCCALHADPALGPDGGSAISSFAVAYHCSPLAACKSLEAGLRGMAAWDVVTDPGLAEFPLTISKILSRNRQSESESDSSCADSSNSDEQFTSRTIGGSTQDTTSLAVKTAAAAAAAEEVQQQLDCARTPTGGIAAADGEVDGMIGSSESEPESVAERVWS